MEKLREAKVLNALPLKEWKSTSLVGLKSVRGDRVATPPPHQAAFGLRSGRLRRRSSGHHGPTARLSHVQPALTKLLRNPVVPTGLSELFPTYPALRLRLRAGLDYLAPMALFSLRVVPPMRWPTEFRNSLLRATRWPTEFRNSLLRAGLASNRTCAARLYSVSTMWVDRAGARLVCIQFRRCGWPSRCVIDFVSCRDVLSAAQRVEHYEMAGYGTVRKATEFGRARPGAGRIPTSGPGLGRVPANEKAREDASSRAGRAIAGWARPLWLRR